MNIKSEDLQKQLNFIHEVDKVKYIYRKTKLFHSERNENDAEHSWHLAVMALILSGHANEPIDLLKVIQMLLIHDIVEIDSGDIFLYSSEVSHTNTDSERKAAQRIFGLLAESQTNELISIWEEFEAGETAEAKFARAMDRLEPLLQNVSNGGGTWKEFGIKHGQVIQKKSIIANGSTTLWDLAKSLIDDAAANGLLDV